MIENPEGRTLGFCVACYRMRWIQVEYPTDGAVYGICTGCYREAEERSRSHTDRQFVEAEASELRIEGPRNPTKT